MKRLIRRLSILAAIVLISGCYMGLEGGSVDREILTLDLQGQAVVGYAGDGEYVRARVYDVDDFDAMISSGVLSYDGGAVYYDTIDLLPSYGTQAFYIGPAIASPYGIVLLADLPPRRRFRVLLEEVNYSSGVSTTNYAAVSGEFELTGGENLTLSMVFLYHSGS